MRTRRKLLEMATLLAILSTISLGFRKELTLEELKARAETAKPDERANLCVQIAERQIEAADKAYVDGKIDEAQSAIRDVVGYSRKAVDAASQTGHKLKNT